jgi:hypothetical protein
MQDTRSPAERAQHYRFRAEVLRTVASEWKDSENREMLQRVANDYERMADRIEKHFTPREPPTLSEVRNA